MIDINILKREERAIFSLRALYKKYGYMPYKMSKFEEYDLYVQNKDFLVSDRVITFNDTNGKLMALKPDVTLSIIKNAEDTPGAKTKVYYNENVYRVSDSTHQYKEIMQAGLECIGDIGEYDVREVVYLALLSLSSISESFLLDVSHLDITSAVLDSISTDAAFRSEILTSLSKKSAHDIERVCAKYGVSDEDCAILCTVSGIYCTLDRAIEILKPICNGGASGAISELEGIWSFIKDTPYADKVRVDFSIVNDMNYYSGIVFSGFIDGISAKVLSGGRYDKLVRRMGKNAGAVGFALYLDLLEGLQNKNDGYDVDTLLLYSDGVSASEICRAVDELIRDGKSVSVQKSIPEKLRYKETVTLGSKEARI